jgi:hypothetical protein
VEQLVDAGCYRMFAPFWKIAAPMQFHGALEAIEAVAAADGSVGWTVSQSILAQVILGYLPRGTLEEVYASGPDLRAAGVFSPKGRMNREDGGWRVKGRWLRAARVRPGYIYSAWSWRIKDWCWAPIDSPSLGLQFCPDGM